MENTEEKTTWRQIKEFVNAMTEEELDTETAWIGEEKSGNKIVPERFECDMINPSGEGIEPITDYQPGGQFYHESDPVVNPDEEPISFPKGFPYLWVD